MTPLHTAARMALDALEAALSDDQPYIERCKAAITALREALTQPAPERWMPIETAPKSNEKVLLISLSGGIRIDTGGFAHHLINAAKVDGDECFLTHWMPLPAAPGAAPPAAPAPGDMVMVPKKPTWEMQQAALEMNRGFHTTGVRPLPETYELWASAEVYRAMIAAAAEIGATHV